MIHQLIFASPKPGMSEPDFQHYWVKIHAVEFAAKIPQIRRYMVCTRLDFDPPDASPLFGGVAEIWLEDEKAQLGSLQSKEYVEGARRDEPRWAAFWNTLALETESRTIVEGPALSAEPTWIKLYTLLKRKEGLPLEAFRERLRDRHTEVASGLPGLRRYSQCVVRDTSYVVGEARFDAVELSWFDDRAALRAALSSAMYRDDVRFSYRNLCEEKYRFQLAAEEHWIIGPELR